MMRLLFLVHRYLGIVVGALMVMWCVSGVVMMYVGYPGLDPAVRLSRLAPIVWRGCCRISDGALEGSEAVGSFRVEMLAGRPVLHLRGAESPGLIDLISGAPIDEVSTAQAEQVAAAFGNVPAPRLLGKIDYDQWTVGDNVAGAAPLYHFALGDHAGSELYVSSASGEAVQLTSAHQRFWNWLGAVPHWLYFAQLRHRPLLWSRIVIWTSLIGCFLAASGLYIGVRQVLCSASGRWSPYRGFQWWHHIAVLIFGLFTLTWIFSGFTSMNPWGWMEGSSAAAVLRRLSGPQITGTQLRAALRGLAAAHPDGIASLEGVPLDGRLYWMAASTDGVRRRLDASGTAAPLGRSDLAYIAGALSGGGGAALRLLTRGDEYYFSQPGSAVRLPVYRLLLRDGTDTRYYVDPVAGTLIAQ
ncbi:MAG: PepSY domain-containing protein, partial [Steroidobacteraceae bacterium]